MLIGDLEVGNVVLVKRNSKKIFLIVVTAFNENIIFFNLEYCILENLSPEEFIEVYGNIIKVYQDYRLDKVIWEKKKEILDDKEKEYLSNFIKPFRDRIRGIILQQYNYSSDLVYIRIVIAEGLTDKPFIDLPLFEKGTMYRGMKLDYKYTLEELGL